MLKLILFISIIITSSATLLLAQPASYFSTSLSDLWSRSISSSSAASFTPPYISPSSNFLIVGSKTESIVAALATSDGNLMWTTSVVGRVNQPPSVFCLDPSNGDKNCAVLAGSSTFTKMFVLNGTTGAQMASKTTTRVIDTTPGAVNDSSSSSGTNLITCFGSTQDFRIWGDNVSLQGNSVATMSSTWNKAISQRPTSACIPVNGNSFAIGVITGDFFLLNAFTGAEIWKQTLFTQVNTPPIRYTDPTHGDIIILATSDGRVIVLRESNGAKIYDLRVSTATGGINSCAIHPNARMIVTGDDDGNVAAVSLVDGLKKWSNKMSSQAIISLTEVYQTSSMNSLSANRLGVTSDAQVGLIAGAGNQLFFLLYVTNSEVKIVFGFSTSSTSLLSGGISTTPLVPNCIFGTQISEVRCINTTFVLAQMDPSKFALGTSDSGLPSWAQILIIVSVVVIVSVAIGFIIICWALPYYRAREDMLRDARNRTNNPNDEVPAGEDADRIRENRIRRHEMELQEQRRREREAQEAERRRQQERDNFRRRHEQARPNAGIFETNIDIVANDDQQQQRQFDDDDDDDDDVNHQELTRIAANATTNNNNNPNRVYNNNNDGNESPETGMVHQASGNYVAAARLELAIFTNRLEMLSTKTESTPAPQLDLATLSFLSDNFAFPLPREIKELHSVVSNSLEVDVLEVYFGAFVFAGRHSDLLICKTSARRQQQQSSNNNKNRNSNNDDDDDDSNNAAPQPNSNSGKKQLRIPPTLHCVLGFVPPNNRDLSWIVVDTELLINASQATTSIGNPLGTIISSSASHQRQQQQQQPLMKIFEEYKQQIGTKTYTCSVCYDSVEIHRTPQQTALIMGTVCSALQQQARNKQSGCHFTCGNCLSGSVEKMLNEGDTSLQMMPCYHSSCVEARNHFNNHNYTPQQASMLIDSDESGYFIFEDFSSVLKPATLRRWQKVSTEAGRALGQKEIMRALPKQSDTENSRVKEHCQRIRGMLRPRCPYCDLEFMGFTGCVCVTCGVRSSQGERIAGCGRQFCGSCMEPFPCSGGHQHDFMNANTIQSNWKVWRNRRVNAYLQDHFAGWRSDETVRRLLERILRTSITDLMEAGIWPLQKPWRDVIPQ